MIIHPLRLNFHRLGELCGEHRLKMPLSGSFLTNVLVLEGALSLVFLAIVQRDNELVGPSSDGFAAAKVATDPEFQPRKSTRDQGPLCAITWPLQPKREW